ncbi:DUF4424 family protein [Luteolibacter yonseiensis]|uniref:DUF4424 family protein n=1 Tax=Luteolibacter yonseiensis TaxID=1144680 RepID=A0A934R532_9BACT|nr:DUF4424 family protein [Luteolibacter yonseiensis]MBK1815329.1 DUF4424 family protein [Luteolibacter yonseiensis]
MKTKVWLGICFTLFLQPVLANGGGYFRGGVERAGDVAGFEPEETEKIRILDEKLTVGLGQKSADVEVRYLMRNETDKKVKVRFGFPVEESFDTSMMVAVGEDASEKTKSLKYCKNYLITASGKSVAVKWQSEEKEVGDKRFKGIAGWLISEITFSAGEEKPVMIRFDSDYPSEEWNVSDNTSESPAMFRYRLSTAACWAGTIGTGHIIIKPAGIDPRELKVIKPVNRFKKDGENWVWNFENLEPSMADDMEIEASPAISGHNDSETSRFVERGSQWLMSHINYEVRASSELPPADGNSYGAGKVKSMWGQETWSEGVPGTGAGEWLELKPVAPKPLAAILVRPGYSKSDGLFQANARPKRIRVTLNGEHSFGVDVPDSNNVRRIPVIGYVKPVKQIRLTFEDVWPGTKFEDLCVSGVWLEVKLDKKPKLGPVR